MDHFLGNNNLVLYFFVAIALIFTSLALYCEVKRSRNRQARNKMLYYAAYGSQEEMFQVQLALGIDLDSPVPVPSGLWGKFRPEHFGLFVCSLLKITAWSDKPSDLLDNIARSLLAHKSRHYQKRFLAGMAGRQHEAILGEFLETLAQVKFEIRHQKSEDRKRKQFERGLTSL